MYSIEIQSGKAYAELEKRAAAAARAVLEMQSAAPGSLTVVLTDERALRDANRQFAGVDRPTDVLSFGDGEQLPDGSGTYFGDVLIAVPLAEQQAARAGCSLADEICLLTVHGVLHLLGFDHAVAPEKDRMWQQQAAALASLGIDPAIVEAT